MVIDSKEQNGGGRTYRGRTGWYGVPRRPEEGKEGGNSLPFPKGGGRIVSVFSCRERQEGSWGRDRGNGPLMPQPEAGRRQP